MSTIARVCNKCEVCVFADTYDLGILDDGSYECFDCRDRAGSMKEGDIATQSPSRYNQQEEHEQGDKERELISDQDSTATEDLDLTELLIECDDRIASLFEVVPNDLLADVQTASWLLERINRKSHALQRQHAELQAELERVTKRLNDSTSTMPSPSIVLFAGFLLSSNIKARTPNTR